MADLFPKTMRRRRRARTRSRCPGMGAMVLAALATGLCLPSPGNPPSTAGALEISAEVDRSEITVGDRFVYTIDVRFPEKGHIELPSVLGNLGAFEVKEYETAPPRTQGGKTLQTWRFTLSTYTLGDFTLPPQRIDFMESGNKLRTSYFTQPIRITVKRTSPEGAKDIADIAGLADIPQAPPWGLIVLCALSAVILGAWAWKRHGRRTVAERGAVPRLPPYEEAQARLAELSATNWVRQNQVRDLGFALSEVLRRYVSRRFSVNGLEATTEEFLGLVAGIPVDNAQRNWIGEFCRRTDLIKFANLGLLETEAAQLMHQLRQFLDSTRPARETSPTGGTEKGKA